MTFLEFVDFLINISIFSGLPVSILYIVLVKNKTIISNVLFFIILLSFICEVANLFFVRHLIANSFYISNVWTVVNFILMVYFFYLLLPNFKKLTLSILIFFIVLTLISLFFYDLSHPNPIINTSSSVAIIFLVIFSFYNLIKAEITIPMLENPIFWILSGFFLFETSILLQGLFLDYLIYTLKVDVTSLMYLHLFNLLANIIKNLIFLPYTFLLVNKGRPIHIYNPKHIGSWQEF